MPSHTSEEIILTSNDNSVTLTTHRLLQKTARLNKEMMLTDIVSHEIIRKRSLVYVIIALLFVGPTIVFFGLFLAKVGPFEPGNKNPPTNILLFFLLFTVLAITLIGARDDKFLRITGKLGKIEIPITRLSQNSLNKFLNRLEAESNNRKREM